MLKEFVSVILASGACKPRVWPAPDDCISNGSGGLGGSGGEFQEARFCAQALWLSNICSEKGVHFSIKSKESMEIMIFATFET